MIRLVAERDGSEQVWGIFPTLEAAEAAVEKAEADDSWPEGCDAVATDEHGKQWLYIDRGHWEAC